MNVSNSNGDSPPVALFLPSLDGGGAERAFVNLSRGMADLGHEVDLVVGNADGPLKAEIPENVALCDLAAPRLLQALPGLVRYLNDRRPGRLYSALEEAGVLALLARRIARSKVVVVTSVRNRLTEEADLGSWKRKRVLQLARYFYSQADGIVAVSDGVADDASDVLFLRREDIHVIRNPTIVPELLAQADMPHDHPWFADHDTPVVLACGRLAPQKDFETLIRAFAKLRGRRVARLVILGDGPLRLRLEKLVKELGLSKNVSLPGFDANPFRYMSRCDVFVLSSSFEGSPNVIVQALACGAPVVSTDCPSGPSEILADIAQGRLVPIGNADIMVDAIEEMLDFPRHLCHRLEMAEYNYLTAAERYLSVNSTNTPR